MVHYDGQACSIAARPTERTLNAIWGASPADLWAVGGGGTIVHYDGAAWTTVPSGTTNDLQGVWGTQPRAVWVVGDGGVILRHLR